MMRLLKYLSLVILLGSCTSDKQKVSKKYLHPDTMKIILYELYLADEVNAARLLNDRTLDRKKENLAYYNRIFEIHQISHERFFKSLNYYMENPELFSVLADSLNNYAQKVLTEGLTDPPKRKKNGHHIQNSSGQTRH